jgi:hypothetical protein
MTEKECREQPKPDWWNPENWKNEDGTEMTSMEMEAWTQPKNPECERYYTDLLIKAQNDGKKFWCREVQVKALVATIDWFSGLTSSSSAARWKPENQTGCLSPSDGASCSAVLFSSGQGSGYQETLRIENVAVKSRNKGNAPKLVILTNERI